jgi:hypothetical protein
VFIVIISAIFFATMFSIMFGKLQQIAAEVGTSDPKLAELTARVTDPGMYAAICMGALISLLPPSLLAWYFFSRTRHVRAFLANTPAWVIDAMK